MPTAAQHPIHRFLQSDVRLVVSADDPGIFDCTLADEIDWVVTHTSLQVETLQARLGDPHHYRFGLHRPFRTHQQTGTSRIHI